MSAAAENWLVTPDLIQAAWMKSEAYQPRVMINGQGWSICPCAARRLAGQLTAAADQAESFAKQMNAASPEDQALFETAQGGLA